MFLLQKNISRFPIQTSNQNEIGGKVCLLQPGVYDLTFASWCGEKTALLSQRLMLPELT